MKGYDLWTMLLGETFLSPTPWTWCVLAVPFVVFLVAVISIRGMTKKPTGAWQRLGRQWLSIGIGVLLIAALFYILDCTLTKKSDTAFEKSVSHRVNLAASNRSKKAMIRELADYQTEDTLKDFSKDFVEKLDSESRIKFVSSWMVSNSKATIVEFYSLLNWPEEKLNAYREQHDGLAPMVTATQLTFDERQQDLFSQQKWPQLYESLREDQWKYLSDQFLGNQAKTNLVSILSTLADYLTEEEVDLLYDELFNRRFGSSDPATRLSWLAGSQERARTFRFFLENVSWLRALPWAVLYLVASLWMICVGVGIYQAGGRRMFEGQTR